MASVKRVATGRADTHARAEGQQASNIAAMSGTFTFPTASTAASALASAPSGCVEVASIVEAARQRVAAGADASPRVFVWEGEPCFNCGHKARYINEPVVRTLVGGIEAYQRNVSTRGGTGARVPTCQVARSVRTYDLGALLKVENASRALSLSPTHAVPLFLSHHRCTRTAALFSARGVMCVSCVLHCGSCHGSWVVLLRWRAASDPATWLSGSLSSPRSCASPSCAASPISSTTRRSPVRGRRLCMRRRGCAH